MPPRTCALALIALATILLGTGVHTPSALGQSETRAVALDADWNLVSWTGPTTSIAEALAPIAADVISVHTFQNDSKTFSNSRRWPTAS